MKYSKIPLLVLSAIIATSVVESMPEPKALAKAKPETLADAEPGALALGK